MPYPGWQNDYIQDVEGDWHPASEIQGYYDRDGGSARTSSYGQNGGQYGTQVNGGRFEDQSRQYYAQGSSAAPQSSRGQHDGYTVKKEEPVDDQRWRSTPNQRMDSEAPSSSAGRSGGSNQFDFRRPYTVTGSGVNDQGNRWTNRDFGPDAPNQNGYRYDNADGSYYYDNPDGSKYYNSGRGFTQYTNPNGGVRQTREERK